MEILRNLLVARGARRWRGFARCAEVARSAGNPRDALPQSARYRRAGAGAVATRSADPDARSAAEDRADSGRDFFTEVEAALPKVALPDHTTVIVEGAGTYVESDAPEEFAAAVRAFSDGAGRPSA